MELQNPNGGLLRSGEGGGGVETSEVDIQTQVNILQSGSFRKRGADRMQADSVPLAPTGQDILLADCGQRIHPATENPDGSRSKRACRLRWRPSMRGPLTGPG